MQWKHQSIFIVSSIILILTACSPAQKTVPAPDPGTEVTAGTVPIQQEEPTHGPTETSTPEPTPTLQVIYQDDFSDPSSGWERYQEMDGYLDYYEGGYRMMVEETDMVFWVVSPGKFQSIRIDVDIEPLDELDTKRMGVLCSYNTEDFSFYGFLFDNNGRSAVLHYMQGEMEILGEEDFIEQDSLKRNARQYHLTAECSDETLRMYVDNQLLHYVKSVSLTEGEIGLLAGTVEEPGVDLLFKSLEVSALESE